MLGPGLLPLSFLEFAKFGSILSPLVPCQLFARIRMISGRSYVLD
jgi:hypothetical protein